MLRRLIEFVIEDSGIVEEMKLISSVFQPTFVHQMFFSAIFQLWKARKNTFCIELPLFFLAAQNLNIRFKSTSVLSIDLNNSITIFLHVLKAKLGFVYLRNKNK